MQYRNIDPLSIASTSFFSLFSGSFCLPGKVYVSLNTLNTELAIRSGCDFIKVSFNLSLFHLQSVDHIGYVLGSCYWLLNYLLCNWLTNLYSRFSLTLGMMISCSSDLKFC